MSLPEAFIGRMRALLGAEAAEFLTALAEPPVQALRVNTLKIATEEFRKRSPWSLEPVPWCCSGFTFSDGAAPGRHPYHAAGLYYVQEPTAMAVAEALAPRPGERVLDVAAAPGGKSTHLACLLNDSGVLVANEIESRRSAALAQNLERWGARVALVTNGDLARLADQWSGLFDRVLLDAPCSGEGMFRKSEAACRAWSVDHVHGCALRQAHALDSAAELVRPGGWLVYSTCTFAPEENEDVIARFLDAHADYALEPVRLPGADPGRPEWAAGRTRSELVRTARYWPHRVRGDGHFIALLHKEAGAPAALEPERWPQVPNRVRRLWQAFAAQMFECDPARDAALLLDGDRLYAAPTAAPPLNGLRLVGPGLWLGTLRAERFEPSHSLALSLRPGELGAGPPRMDFHPDDGRLAHYLRGHPLDDAGSDGWVLVTVSGFPLGWGRRAHGIVKNYYPKGLRWMEA